MSTLNIGEEGFWWFLGIVEDREDPLKLGRVRVRIHNIHSDKQAELPTDNIPWAVCMLPITSASLGQVGTAPTGIMVGSTVFGFFMDGRSCQTPVILGTMPGIPGNNVQQHDVPAEARGEHRIVKDSVGPEPSSPFQAKYPYNKVVRTEAGHVIELDDTPGSERIHVFHKAGSYVEIDSSGQMVLKTVSDRYDVAAGNMTTHAEGKVTINSQGDMVIQTPGKLTLKAAQLVFDCKKTNFTGGSGGTFEVTGTDISIAASASINLNAPDVNI